MKNIICPTCNGKGRVEYSEELIFGINVKRLRGLRGLKQVEMAKMLGVSRASIANIETGKQHPPLDKIFNIAKILHVDVKELF